MKTMVLLASLLITSLLAVADPPTASRNLAGGPCAAPVEIPATLINGWENYGWPFKPASFYKDCTGRVHLAGMVRKPVGQWQEGHAFTLPAGYRPNGYEIFAGGGPGYHTEVHIVGNLGPGWTDGAVTVCCTEVAVSLSGASFLAGP